MCSMEVHGGGTAFGGVFVRASEQHIDQYFCLRAVPRTNEKVDARPSSREPARSRKIADQCGQHFHTPREREFKRQQKQASAALEPHAVAACSGRAFFVNENNYMGLAPSVSRPGDEVCIILGCPIPFIIRPLEVRKLWTDTGEMIEQKHYVLVG